MGALSAKGISIVAFGPHDNFDQILYVLYLGKNKIRIHKYYLNPTKIGLAACQWWERERMCA
jgi:hypothetical protein